MYRKSYQIYSDIDSDIFKRSLRSACIIILTLKGLGWENQQQSSELTKTCYSFQELIYNAFIYERIYFILENEIKATATQPPMKTIHLQVDTSTLSSVQREESSANGRSY